MVLEIKWNVISKEYFNISQDTSVHLKLYQSLEIDLKS